MPFGIKAIERLPEGRLALGAPQKVAGGGNGATDGLPLRFLRQEWQRAPK